MIVGAFPFGSGFPLQSLTWVKGFSLSCAYTLAHGLSRPGVRCRPLRQAATGHRGGRTNGTRPSVPSHGASAIAETSRAPSRPKEFPPCLSGSRKLTVLPYTSPARMSLPWETGVPGSPEGFFFPHPASNRPLTGMTDRAFFP